LNEFEVVEADYAKGIPGERCDLMCSALSIHHLEHADKKSAFMKFGVVLAMKE
jgi:hypothetical protein